MPSSPRDYSPLFWALVLATFLGFLGMGTVLPQMAPHALFYYLGGSDRTVGFVIGIFSLSWRSAAGSSQARWRIIAAGRSRF